MPQAELAEANNTFSLSLFRRLSENNYNGNVFYSPLSISSALAMVLLGARGNTAAQMSQVLHFKGDVHMDFSELMNHLNKSTKSYTLSLANRLYVEQSFQFEEELLSATREHYDAEPEPVDFVGNAEGARLNVNGWVEKQTRGKIRGLLSPGTVNGHTRLLLVNAIYFKAKWKEPFDKDGTRDRPFRLSKTESKPVKMMYQTTRVPLAYIPEVNCMVLEQPYMGKRLSMLILLPYAMEDNTTGLEKIERELTYERFTDWTDPDKMKFLRVRLGLPRFKMEETYDMRDVLIGMGMVDAFNEARSDFSGMSPLADGLALSQVVHKALVEVNEEGTEAAAATAYGFQVISGAKPPSPPPLFVVDHPFLFFIRHNPTMSILFAGRYCSPP